MSRLVLIMSFLFIGMTLKAQHTLSGIVTNKADASKLVEGVAIFVPEYNKFDVSKEGGTYIIRNVGSGMVTIQFAKTGFKSVVKTIALEDSATVLDIDMEPSSIELEEVVVTSNNTKLPDFIPYNVQTISLTELTRNGAPNVLTALSYEPGIDRISMGTGINKPVIRGLSFNRILLYQSGTRLENQPWDDRHDIGINENGVEKVEVVKGPAALIYGPDAMGGALIFTDEKPAISGTSVGDVNLGIYSNTFGVNLNTGVKGSNINGFFYDFRVGVQSHTSYIQGGTDQFQKNSEEKNFAFNSKYNTMNGKASVGVSKKWGVSKLTYSYQRQQTGIIEFEDITANPADNTEQRDRQLEAPYQDVTSNLLSSENTFPLKKSKINLNVSYQMNDRKEFEPNGIPKGKEEAFALKLNTINYDVKYSSNAEKRFGYTIGSQSFFQTNRNSGLLGLVPDADVNDIAVYGLVRYDVKKWNFLAGGRFDQRTMKADTYIGVDDTNKALVHIDKTYSLMNGSVGLAFHPLNDLTLKLNVASGFTAPNYAQLASNGKHEGAFRYEIGNANLDIEQNLQTDFGVIWELRDFSFNLSTYYNRINKYIYISYIGRDTIYKNDTLSVYRYSQKDATISGAEISVDIHPQKISWIDLMVSFANIRGEFVNGGNIPYIPSNKVVGALKFQKAQMKYIYNPYVSIIVSNYSAQTKAAEFETATASYALLDLHFGGSFAWGQHEFDLSLSATNILNTGYYNSLSLLKEIGVKEMGRNIAVNLRIPFTLKKAGVTKVN